MWYIIVYYVVIIKCPVISNLISLRSLARMSDLYKTNAMRATPLRGVLPRAVAPIALIPTTPSSFVSQTTSAQTPPKPKPKCGPVPFPDYSCEPEDSTTTTCKVYEGPYLEAALLHKDEVVCNPLYSKTPPKTNVKQEHPRIMRTRKPQQMIPTRMMAKSQYVSRQYKERDTQVRADQPYFYPNRQVHHEYLNDEIVADRPAEQVEHPDLASTSTNPPASDMTDPTSTTTPQSTTSTMPPYPGGIKPESEEKSEMFELCGIKARCNKFVWTSSKKHNRKTTDDIIPLLMS